jgi:rRNA maturation endonuclease Nob1
VVYVKRVKTVRVIKKRESVNDQNSIQLYDTSGLIEASQRNISVDSGYTVPMIEKEMYTFLPGNGRNGAHIQPKYLDAMTTNLPKANASISYRMGLREDIYHVDSEVNAGKKTENDPISFADVSLVAAAIKLAVNSNHVDVYSTDAHVINTLDGLLNSPKYSHLKPLVSVKSHKEEAVA